MGMDQTVTFAAGPPPWPAVRDRLARHGFPAQLRMIDGELALPDEDPPESWRELRLGTPQGMVTVRRAADRVVCVTWGNADLALREAWNALAWAFAAAGGGQVQAPQGPQDAAAFRAHAELPASLRGPADDAPPAGPP
jgi:hypothetical protein